MPFVSFEGIDGSGKTVQAEILATSLRAMNLKVLKTKEPDGGWIGSSVRSILVSERSGQLSAQEEMLLISAARFDHVKNVIRPALKAGHWVVSDRFVDSTFAFQVFKTGVSEEAFQAITSEVVGDTMPDFTFILDIDPAVAIQRRKDRMEGSDIDPAEITRDFTRIRDGLLEAAKRAPNRCHIVDAHASLRDVADSVISIIKRSAYL